MATTDSKQPAKQRRRSRAEEEDAEQSPHSRAEEGDPEQRKQGEKDAPKA
jgi:hypothetical protein